MRHKAGLSSDPAARTAPRRSPGTAARRCAPCRPSPGGCSPPGTRRPPGGPLGARPAPSQGLQRSLRCGAVAAARGGVAG